MQNDRVRSAELAEQNLLDEIEASTSRTYQHSVRFHDEVTGQNIKMDEMEGQFHSSKNALSKETSSIAETRKLGQGLLWMYGVIAAEVVIMLLLLYIGLS